MAAAAKRKVAPPSPRTPTPSVADFLEKAKKFANDSAKAKGITKRIMEFIALDDQPFSVVEDVVFRRLIDHIEPRYTMPSRRHFSDVRCITSFQFTSMSSWLQILQPSASQLIFGAQM